MSSTPLALGNTPPIVVVEKYPDAAYRYSPLQDGTPRLTSGGFLFEQDARNCGDHIALDKDVALYFKD